MLPNPKFFDEQMNRYKAEAYELVKDALKDWDENLFSGHCPLRDKCEAGVAQLEFDIKFPLNKLQQFKHKEIFFQLMFYSTGFYCIVEYEEQGKWCKAKFVAQRMTRERYEEQC